MIDVSCVYFVEMCMCVVCAVLLAEIFFYRSLLFFFVFVGSIRSKFEFSSFTLVMWLIYVSADFFSLSPAQLLKLFTYFHIYQRLFSRRFDCFFSFQMKSKMGKFTVSDNLIDARLMSVLDWT